MKIIDHLQAILQEVQAEQDFAAEVMKESLAKSMLDLEDEEAVVTAARAHYKATRGKIRYYRQLGETMQSLITQHQAFEDTEIASTLDMTATLQEVAASANFQPLPLPRVIKQNETELTAVLQEPVTPAPVSPPETPSEVVPEDTAASEVFKAIADSPRTVSEVASETTPTETEPVSTETEPVSTETEDENAMREGADRVRELVLATMYKDMFHPDYYGGKQTQIKVAVWDFASQRDLLTRSDRTLVNQTRTTQSPRLQRQVAYSLVTLNQNGFVNKNLDGIGIYYLTKKGIRRAQEIIEQKGW